MPILNSQDPLKPVMPSIPTAARLTSIPQPQISVALHSCEVCDIFQQLNIFAVLSLRHHQINAVYHQQQGPREANKRCSQQIAQQEKFPQLHGLQQSWKYCEKECFTWHFLQSLWPYNSHHRDACMCRQGKALHCIIEQVHVTTIDYSFCSCFSLQILAAFCLVLLSAISLWNTLPKPFLSASSSSSFSFLSHLDAHFVSDKFCLDLP